MIMQTKIIKDLSKIKKSKLDEEEREIKSDDSDDNPFDIEDFNPGAKD